MWQADIHVTLKRGVLDPQGGAVQRSLGALGYEGVADVRVGKYMQVRLDAANREAAARQVDEMCRRLLANPVIEEYRYELKEAGQ